MTTPLLDARDVAVTIGGLPIVTAADLVLSEGRLTAVVGPNGAGKSTLVRAVAGLQKTSDGSIRWRGEELERIRRRALARTRAFVPQRATVPDGVTVRQAVTIGRAPHVKPLGRLTGADSDAVEAAIRRAGVEDFADRFLTTLSGGELQRVQLAVGLAQATPALLADEPASSLDLGAASGLARTLRSLVEDDGLAVLLVVHDLALAAAVADEVVVMAGGRTVATGPPAEVLDAHRLADVWGVDADLHRDVFGRTGLHVAWL